MDHRLGEVAERLFVDLNGRIPLDTVFAVVRETAAEHPGKPLEELEQEALIKIQIGDQGRSEAGGPTGG